MELSAASVSFFGKQVSYTPPVAGSYVDGRWKPGAGEAKPIKAVIQPISLPELQNLPEGIREKAMYSMWTREPLEADPDLAYGSVLWRGQTYRILQAVERDGFSKAVLGLERDAGRNRKQAP
ncbi:MAG: hypothetical protein KDJ69_11960 [Nitratireductor sp.]|nr:hypothetical protein [Nitratireductor sp.]